MTMLLHRFPDANAFDQKALNAELNYLVHSVAGRTTIAENYVGLPFDS
jgi:p-hydroxybenzoate 3-monooxygenase